MNETSAWTTRYVIQQYAPVELMFSFLRTLDFIHALPEVTR